MGYIFLQIRLHEEHERCLLYLDASTRKPLIATAERQLLERHISAILDKVCIAFSYSWIPLNPPSVCALNNCCFFDLSRGS